MCLTVVQLLVAAGSLQGAAPSGAVGMLICREKLLQRCRGTHHHSRNAVRQKVPFQACSLSAYGLQSVRQPAVQTLLLLDMLAVAKQVWARVSSQSFMACSEGILKNNNNDDSNNNNNAARATKQTRCDVLEIQQVADRARSGAAQKSKVSKADRHALKHEPSASLLLSLMARRAGHAPLGRSNKSLPCRLSTRAGGASEGFPVIRLASQLHMEAGSRMKACERR